MATKTKTKKIKIKASDLLFLAILLYLSQFIENLFHYLIEWTPLIDVLPLGNMWWTLILRLLCIASWVGVLWLTVKCSIKYGYDPRGVRDEVKRAEWIAPLVIAAAFIILVILWDGGFGAFWTALGNMGGVLESVSYLAFLVPQVMIMVLVIALSQKAFEIIFPKAWRYLPFGGLFLGVCMMVTNFITGVSAEGWTPLVLPLILAVQTLYGVVYVLTGKRAWLTFVFVYPMFFIF